MLDRHSSITTAQSPHAMSVGLCLPTSDPNGQIERAKLRRPRYHNSAQKLNWISKRFSTASSSPSSARHTCPLQIRSDSQSRSDARITLIHTLHASLSPRSASLLIMFESVEPSSTMISSQQRKVCLRMLSTAAFT